MQRSRLQHGAPLLPIIALLILAVTAVSQEPRSTRVSSSPQPSPVEDREAGLEAVEPSMFDAVYENRVVILVFGISLGLIVFGILHLPNLLSYIRTRSRKSYPVRQRTRPLVSERYSAAASVQRKPVLEQDDEVKRLFPRPLVIDSESSSLSDKSHAPTSPKYQPGEIIVQPAKQTLEGGVPAPDHDARRLDQLMENITHLREMLDQKADRRAEAESKDTINKLETRIMQTEQKLAGAILDLKMWVAKKVVINDQPGKVTEQHLNALLQEMASLETRLQSRISQFESSLAQSVMPDSFVVKTLGAVIGENIETLRDGKFEQLVGERLNQFFQTSVEHGESLQNLRERAEAINIGLKRVATQIEKLNTAAYGEARPHLQRVEAFAHELSELQSQMQSRRATVETVLRIPVSLHTAARRTFLDELGRGIKQEINKLSDPQSYFTNGLRQLLTTDIISVVDICDRKVAHPGAQAALESSLAQLFEQVSLRQLTPRQGDAFRAAEHELLQVVDGGPGKSLSVAQVVARGFYYGYHENETLLRKAKVNVYR